MLILFSLPKESLANEPSKDFDVEKFMQMNINQAKVFVDYCSAQNESYAEKIWHKFYFDATVNKPQSIRDLNEKELESNYQNKMRSFKESAWGVCMNKKQILSNNLCEDIGAAMLNGSIRLIVDTLFKHVEEMKKNDENFKKMNDAFGGPDSANVCPE